jgi:hypothetical protein
MPSRSVTAAPPRPALPTLAGRTFPRRVGQLLRGILDYAASELEGRLGQALNEYEQNLFVRLSQAQSAAVRDTFNASLIEFRRGRRELVAAFLGQLEAGLATAGDPPDAARAAPLRASAPTLSLSLVEDVVVEESIVVSEASNRAEIRNSLALYLLGQRFGVIFARPAFDASTLPVGPLRLCEYLVEAAHCLELGVEHRQLLLKQFDRHLLQPIGPFYDTLNNYLIEQRVLPALTYVPIRARPVAQADAPQRGAAAPREVELGLETVPHEPTASAPPPPPAAVAASPDPATALTQVAELLATLSEEPHPVTAWPGQADQGEALDLELQEAALFAALRAMLAGRRSLVGKLGGNARAGNADSERIAGGDDLQRGLARLQGQPAGLRGRTVAQLKQDLLAQLRLTSPGGEASALAASDSDAIDLVGMLLDNVVKLLRPDSPVLALLQKLQVPLVRAALADKRFFTRTEHPARRLLNAIAETGEFLTLADPADRDLLERMRALVERATRDYQGDPALFAELYDELHHHLQAQARKAEVAERRHIEAARGREKLETARQRAAETLDALLAGRRAPLFIRTLLGQAWSDVLALALLRGGEGSDAFRRHLSLAERLLELADARRSGVAITLTPEEARRLSDAVEAALAQVGYHAEDAHAVAARLVAAEDADDDDAASSTELALRLKQKVRLGHKLDEAGAVRPESLKPDARAALERLAQLPFGTWFEFRTGTGSDRRRLSWYSAATGHCLLLNHRGHKLADSTLAALAVVVAAGRARVLMQPSGHVVDRAWASIVRALHAFATAAEGRPS